MEIERLEPAASIVRRFGGEAAVSEITGTAFTAPYRWQYAREKGGTNGRIPRKPLAALIAHGREHGVVITPEEMLQLAGLDEGQCA